MPEVFGIGQGYVVAQVVDGGQGVGCQGAPAAVRLLYSQLHNRMDSLQPNTTAMVIILSQLSNRLNKSHTKKSLSLNQKNIEDFSGEKRSGE